MYVKSIRIVEEADLWLSNYSLDPPNLGSMLKTIARPQYAVSWKPRQDVFANNPHLVFHFLTRWYIFSLFPSTLATKRAVVKRKSLNLEEREREREKKTEKSK